MPSRSLSNRPLPFLLPFGCLFIGLLGGGSGGAIPLTPAAWLLSIGLWLMCERWWKRLSTIAFCVVLVAAGYAMGLQLLPSADWEGQDVTVVGSVTDVRSLAAYQRVLVDADGFGLLAVHLPDSESVSRGDTIRGSGTLERPSASRNPGEFCYKAYLQSLGIIYVWDAASFAVEKGTPGIAELAARRVEKNLENLLTNNDFVSALVLGRRTALSPEDRNRWAEAGVSHLLAISGMHIGLLMALLMTVFRWVRVPSGVRPVLASLLLCFYVVMIGGRPSAWRALIASIVMVRSLSYTREPLHAWSLAGFMLLVVAPNMYRDLGFQLSFAASGGILLWLPAIRRIPRIFQGFGISLAAQSSLVPILITQFGYVSLLAPVSVLILLPFVMSVLCGGLIIGIVGAPARFLAPVVDGLAGLVGVIIEQLARPSAVLSLQDVWWYSWVCWYGCYLSAGFLGRPRYVFFPKLRLIRAALFLCCLLLPFALPAHLVRPLEVTVIDVGQGDAILVRTPYRQHVLVDGGGDSLYWQRRGRNVGIDTLLPYLDHRSIDHLDLVVLTHPHEDHLFGLLSVLETMSVGQVIDNGDPHTTVSYERYLELIDKKEISHRTARRGDRLLLRGGIEIDVMHPGNLMRGTGSDLNNNSLVLFLTYQGRSFLFTGDIDAAGQAQLKRHNVPKADWLKVPHHGSLSAWDPEFIERVSPKTAVIPVGSNSFGHPHPDVVQNLNQRGVRVHRTDRDGAVTYYVWMGFFGRFLSGCWRIMN